MNADLALEPQIEFEGAMMSPLLDRLAQGPRMWLLWVGSLASVCAAALSWGAVPSLNTEAGFAQAIVQVEILLEEGDAYVAVWPPDRVDTLEQLPAAWRAGDAIPPNGIERKLIIIGPTGFAEPPEVSDAEAAPRQRFENIEVAAFSFAGRDSRLFDLRQQIAMSRVSMRHDGGVLACSQSRAAGGWECPTRPTWNHVGPTTMRVEAQDWPCVWAHPVANETLDIAIDDQQLADIVRLEAALSDSAALLSQGAPVNLTLEIEGVGTRTLKRTNAKGIATLDVDTRELRGQQASIRVSIVTSRDARRHLGINLSIIASAEEHE